MSDTPETSTQTTVVATQDGSIKENSSTNGNWSKNEVYGGSTPVIALVEFDLSSFSKNDSIQSATFRPYVRTLKNNQSSSFSIYSTTAKDWSQSSVKWSTRPPKDQLLDTITITKSGSYVDFEVTDAIQDAIDNGQSKVTLWIEDSEKEYEGFEFDSVNKNASYPNEPELVIVSGVAEPDTTAPTFSSAATSTDGTKVILTYNEALSSTTAAASDFTIEVNGSAATISNVATSGSTVELTLSSAVVYGQTITVAYTDPTSGNDSNAIQDGAGNDAGDLSTTTVSNQVAEAGQGILQILGSTVNDKDWDQHVGGKHLRADLSQLNNRDTTKAITYQWYADGEAVSGATSRDFKLEDHSISNEAIHLVATYTTLSGQQRIATSPTLNQLDWRIFSGGEDSSIAGDYPYTGIMESYLVGDNPTPFMATYSFASSSRTHGGNGWYEDGYRASETHSITSINASDQGLPTQEGTNILKIAATSDSKRVELGNRNFNTRVQENQDVYVSQKVYLPSSEWDSVTQYSTLIFQHKQYPGSDPNFEIRLSNLGDYKLYVRSPYSHYGLTGQRVTDYPVATLNPDTWHDLKIHLTPSKSNNVGQMTIYLDGEVIFSEQGTNLNDIDSTNDSFLKLGMYTQILDDRHYFVDSVEMTTFLPSTVSDWVTGATTVVTSPTRLLTILNLENGSVTGGGTFSLGLDATLTATPSAGYIFASWSGDASSTDNPLTVTMDDNKSIGATFTEDTRDPDGDGLSNYQELVVLGTDPIDEDSDADGYNDGDEVTDGTDPNDSDSYPDPDKTAPTFSSAATSTDGTKVILTYNEGLSSTTASVSDFTIEVDGSAATISSVATSGSTVELSLNSAVAYGQTVTVAYTDPTSGNDSNAIQDGAGNDASNLITTAVTNQVRDTSRTNTGPRILGTAEDYSGVRGVLLADIYGVADLDQTKTNSYQWLANGNAIAGATNQTLDVVDFKSSIENKEISVQLTYTNTSGQETTVTSAVMPYEGFRIVANAEDGRNEWSGTTASEEVTGSVNPYPFVESYSNNGTSSTDGTSAGSAHNITAVKASDAGITAREGDNIIRIYADGSKSNRSELAHLNNETTFKEGEEYYFSGSFFAPKSEWDPVTEGGSTVITQLKQYGGGDPNFELRLSNNGDYKMFWRAVPHSLDDYQDMGSAIPDAWNDLKIYTKHSQGSDGVFRVWLNSEKVVDYSGATMYRSAEGYLKFGMYTEIHDERIIYWDAIDIADHLENDFDTWLSSGDNLPSLTVSGISDNQQFTSSDQLSISGNAIDTAGNQLGSSGGIQSVDLFLGDTKIQSTTDSNFSFSNLNLSNGEHNLRLIATDTDGNTAEKSYTIWIGNRPAEVSIEASDFFLGSFSTDSDVALTTTAADPDGSIVTVEFLANGQLIETASQDNGNQYSLNWRPSQAGTYSIQARATDNQGAVTLSDSIAALVGTSITDTTLTATQDVTITQNSSTTGNYSNTEIYGSTSAPKIALVEFDLSHISSAKYIESAAFKPYVTKLQNAPGTFSIYAAGTENWSQTSADWLDKPSKGKLLDTITISSTNQYASFDVTEALQDAVDAGQTKITLWIEDSEQEQQRFDFASENNTSINKPAQLVTSSATEALPAPVEGSYVLMGDPFQIYVADLPVGLQGAEDDPDKDGQSNIFEFVYGTLADVASSRTRIYDSANIVGSTEINETNPGSKLPAGQTHYTVTFRFPYDSQGVTITPEATLNLGNFGDGSAQVIPLGDPVDEGDYYLQRYYLTPDQSVASRGFTRIKLER